MESNKHVDLRKFENLVKNKRKTAISENFVRTLKSLLRF